jgi:septum formation protein
LSVSETFDVYLASGSPRRGELLEQAGVTFIRTVAPVDESVLDKEEASAYVERLAIAKARAGLAQLKSDGLVVKPVLGSDTAVVVDGEILGKPEDYQDFYRMMTLLSGRSHQVMSSVAVLDDDCQRSVVSITQVTFIPLSEAQIERYWRTGEPLDKAGGYGIQGRGGLFVETMSGSYTGVVGLPLCETADLLEQFNISCR